MISLKSSKSPLEITYGIARELFSLKCKKTALWK